MSRDRIAVAVTQIEQQAGQGCAGAVGRGSGLGLCSGRGRPGNPNGPGARTGADGGHDGVLSQG